MVARWNLKFIIAPSSEVLNLSNWVRRPTHCMMDDSTTQCNPVDELALVLGGRAMPSGIRSPAPAMPFGIRRCAFCFFTVTGCARVEEYCFMGETAVG